MVPDPRFRVSITLVSPWLAYSSGFIRVMDTLLDASNRRPTAFLVEAFGESV